MNRYSKMVLTAVLGLLCSTAASGATTLEAKLVPDSGPSRTVAWTVALDEATAVVADPYSDVHRPGEVFIFQTAGGDWYQADRLFEPDGEPDDEFGYAVAIHGSTILVGVPSDLVGPDVERGSVAVYEQSAPDEPWLLTSRLFHPLTDPSRGFGRAVAIFEDTALASAGGDPYLFERAGGVWSITQRLTLPPGVPRYPAYLAIADGVVVVGDPEADQDQGLVYVFERAESGTWEHVQTLTPDTAAPYSQFGSSIAVDDDTIVVGSPHEEVFDGTGAAYVYERLPVSGWVQSQRLVTPADLETDAFGWKVAIDGRRLVVGALGEGVCLMTCSWTSPAIVLFERSGPVGPWTEREVVRHPEIPDAPNGTLAYSLDLSGNRVLTNGGELFSRVAYVFATDRAVVEVPTLGRWALFLLLLLLTGTALAALRRG